MIRRNVHYSRNSRPDPTFSEYLRSHNQWECRLFEENNPDAVFPSRENDDFVFPRIESGVFRATVLGTREDPHLRVFSTLQLPSLYTTPGFLVLERHSISSCNRPLDVDPDAFESR